MGRERSSGGGTPLGPSRRPPGLLSGRRQAPVHCVPADGVPPGGDVVRPLVLVLEVVGVLPDVDAQDRDAALHGGVVLVGEAPDRPPAALQVGPAPTAPELADGRLAERVLEAGGVAERLVAGGRRRARRLAAPVRGPPPPEDRAGVV